MTGYLKLFRAFRGSLVVLFVMISDLACILAGFTLAGFLTDVLRWGHDTHWLESPEILVTLIVFFGLQVSLGSYRSFRSVSPSKQNRIALRSYLYGFLMICGISFVIRREVYLEPRFMLSILFLPAFYLVIRSFIWSLTTRIHPSGLGALRTLVIGEGVMLKRIVPWLERIPGYDLVDVIPSGSTGPQTTTEVERVDLEGRIVAEQIDLVLLSPSSMNGSKEYLERLCRTRHIHVRIIPPEIDVLFTNTTIDDLMGIPLVLPANDSFPRGRILFKRLVDLAGATILTVFLSPLLLIVAVATKLETPGPVLFRQRRNLSGTDSAFDIYKFRSMTVEAERDKTILRNESTGALFKVREDPRVTKVGRFIRRYSIDELPQLINIFRGEMSLVGPRPLPVEDYARISEEDSIHSLYRHRSAMKPGLTGLWQISGRSDLGFREMVLLDVYYIENHTHLFDLEIMLRTIPAVLFARGAY